MTLKLIPKQTLDKRPTQLVHTLMTINQNDQKEYQRM